MTRFLQCWQCQERIELPEGESRLVVPCPHCAADIPNSWLPSSPLPAPTSARGSSTQIAVGEPPVVTTERETAFAPICEQCGLQFSRLLRYCPGCGREWDTIGPGTAAATKASLEKPRNLWQAMGCLIGYSAAIPVGLALFLLWNGPGNLNPVLGPPMALALFPLLVLLLVGLGLRSSTSQRRRNLGEGVLQFSRGLLLGGLVLLGMCAGLGILFLAACSGCGLR